MMLYDVWALEEQALSGRAGFGGADVHPLLIPKESLPYLFSLLSPLQYHLPRLGLGVHSLCGITVHVDIGVTGLLFACDTFSQCLELYRSPSSVFDY